MVLDVNDASGTPEHHFRTEAGGARDNGPDRNVRAIRALGQLLGTMSMVTSILPRTACE